MAEATEMGALIRKVAQVEFVTGTPVACRRPGADLTVGGRLCTGCPAWRPCKGFGIRYPGALAVVSPAQTSWRSSARQSIKEDS